MATRRAPLRYDVVIAGAGPAGATSAIALRNRGLSVALLERQGGEHEGGEPSENAARGDAATQRGVWSPGEGLSAAGQSALHELGLWEAFKAQGHRPSYLTQSAWGSDELREKHAISHERGPDYHLDRAHFDRWLRERATAAGAVLIDAARVTSATWVEAGRFMLSCSRALRSSLGEPPTGEELTLEAPQLIDATGRSAWLLRRFGGLRRQAAELVCVGRCYENALFEPSILVEAAPDGWWYSAPLPDQRALALYFTRAAGARAARSEDGWRATLTLAARTARRLAAATPAGSTRIYPAAPVTSIWRSELPLLPVGDAAAAFDPISGSGLCFAFRSALEAALVLDEARSGRAQLYAGFQQGVGNVFEQHLRQRRELYAHERRWPDSAFWAGAHTEH
jgi:flavin-dependent dehydrogenase